MRTSPVQPAPSALQAIAIFAVAFLLPVTFAAMAVYGWSTP
ncbi:hypothetical protein [Variovorax beijingensis]|nr:hypothetical protein [Variovorax beijingensis]